MNTSLPCRHEPSSTGRKILTPECVDFHMPNIPFHMAAGSKSNHALGYLSVIANRDIDRSQSAALSEERIRFTNKRDDPREEEG